LFQPRIISSQGFFPASLLFQLECNPGDNIFRARGETILERASSRQGLFHSHELISGRNFFQPCAVSSFTQITPSPATAALPELDPLTGAEPR